MNPSKSLHTYNATLASDDANLDSTGGYFSFLFDKALYEDEFKLDYYPHNKPFIKEMPEFLSYSIYLKHKESKINFK